MSANLSKSRYCTGVQCPKILWLDAHRSEEKDASVINQARMDAGSQVGELARGYFGDFAAVPYNADKSIMIAETQKLISAKNAVICEASFANESGFCSVDILRCLEDGFEIVEVKSSTSPKDIYFDDMAFQYYVLTSCGLDVKKVSLLHINSKYVRTGELDIQKLFALADCTEQVKERQKGIAENIAKIKDIAGSEVEPDIAPGKQCDKPYPCAYKRYCNRIIDREKIGAFLDTLRYPLYHLDFETFQEAVPSFDRQSPYQQIPFQYSLHIQPEAGGECEHREFLAEPGTDPRRAIAERLCKDIPKDVCVLAWYMSFEKGRIKELAGIFPDLADHLMSIHNNIKDLIVPFKNKAWRSPEQEGSNSIKYVLPAMFPDEPELDYGGLDLIHNGDEASAAFLDLPNHPAKEQKRIRAALLAYCKLDTFAMVRILNKLVETAGK